MVAVEYWICEGVGGEVNIYPSISLQPYNQWIEINIYFLFKRGTKYLKEEPRHYHWWLSNDISYMDSFPSEDYLTLTPNYSG